MAASAGDKPTTVDANARFLSEGSNRTLCFRIATRADMPLTPPNSAIIAPMKKEASTGRARIRKMSPAIGFVNKTSKANAIGQLNSDAPIIDHLNPVFGNDLFPVLLSCCISPSNPLAS